MAASLSAVFDRLWVPAEIFLFVLVGASVAIGSALNAGSIWIKEQKTGPA